MDYLRRSRLFRVVYDMIRFAIFTVSAHNEEPIRLSIEDQLSFLSFASELELSCIDHIFVIRHVLKNSL